MKRRFLLIGLAAAISTLTNCTQEIDQPIDTTEVSQGIPFEIVASPAETKISLDGLTAVWEEGDALNVFHAEANNTVYVDDGKFTLTENNVFSGNLASAPVGTTDWYAMYPYSQYLETPNNNNGAYYSVWNKNSMTQSGNDNNSHLCGSGFPMYGKGTFGQDEAVVIEMEHVASVVKVVVTNSLEEPLTVTDVTFTAPVDIVGQYYINIAGEEATFTPRGESYVNSIASLIVSEGGAIEEDASAEFYIGLRPFTAASGSTLKISVNGTEKSIVLPNDVTFSPGKIKTLNFNYDVETPPTEATVTEFLSAEESSVWYQLEGVITDISNPTHGNFDLVDETGSVYVYGVLPSKGAEKGQFSTLGLKEGDVVTIIGNRGSHNSNPQVTNAYYVSHETAVDAPVIAFADNTVTLTCATDGATIYYTTDGSDPMTSETKVEYSAPFTIEETCTVKAYATKESMPNSIVASKECVFVSADPPLADGTYVILAKQGEVYYAMASTHETNGNRLDEYTFDITSTETNDQSIVWTFENVSQSNYSITNSGQYLTASSSNDANVTSEESAMSITDNGDGTFCILSDTGRYLSRNDSSLGFAFYGNNLQNEILYIQPITYVDLPELSAPVVTATAENKTITVTWTDVENATSYLVSCGDKSSEVAPDVETCSFTMEEYGSYDVTVTAKAEGYFSATSEIISIQIYDSGSAIVYSIFSGDLVEGDYIIVYGGGAMKASITSSRLDYSDVIISDNEITNPSEDLVWHISKSGDYWTIYNTSVEKYAAGTGAKNKAQLLASGTDDKSLWTVSGDGTYDFVNKANAAAKVNSTLRRNSTYGFACYATGTGGPLTLYKLSE